MTIIKELRILFKAITTNPLYQEKTEKYILKTCDDLFIKNLALWSFKLLHSGENCLYKAEFQEIFLLGSVLHDYDFFNGILRNLHCHQRTL